PADLSGRLGATPLQAVIRAVQKILDGGTCHAILLMGDLSTRGDKAEYLVCLRYLSEALWSRTDQPFPLDNVLIVPGNHDVNRDDARDPGGASKFDYINAALSAAGLRTIGIDSGATIELVANLARLEIVGINTCVGCGSM